MGQFQYTGSPTLVVYCVHFSLAALAVLHSGTPAPLGYNEVMHIYERPVFSDTTHSSRHFYSGCTRNSVMEFSHYVTDSSPS